MPGGLWIGWSGVLDLQKLGDGSVLTPQVSHYSRASASLNGMIPVPDLW
jgi:hypothetical protein